MEALNLYDADSACGAPPPKTFQGDFDLDLVDEDELPYESSSRASTLSPERVLRAGDDDGGDGGDWRAKRVRSESPVRNGVGVRGMSVGALQLESGAVSELGLTFGVSRSAPATRAGSADV